MAVVWSLNKFKADAEKVWSDLQNIEQKTPQNVVDYAAENPDSELYKCFTWDDTKAANSWRKKEARTIMQLLVVRDDIEDDKEPVQFRILQNVQNEYKPVREIVRNQDEYAELLNRAKAELQSFKKRYENIAELETVIEAIDEYISA